MLSSKTLEVLPNEINSFYSSLMNSKGFTLIELLIAVAICGIGLVVIVDAMNGNSILPSKRQCINSGGKWTEGIQYGRMTQLCTYN